MNYQPENITDIGRKNLENLKSLGFYLISIRPNPKIMKKLIKFDFFNHLNFVKASEFPLYASTYIIAEKFNIPLIIQGENPSLTMGTSLTQVGKGSNALKAYQLQTLSNGIDEYLSIDGIDKNDLYFFQYDVKKLLENNVVGIWLQYYLQDWSSSGNAKFAKKYGFQDRKNINPEEIGTYVSYNAVDSDFVHLNQMLKFMKFGFGQCMDHVCYDLRDNLIDRKTAIDLVLKYDGKCAEKYIDEFCKYIEISKDEFWATVNKFRGPMWYDTNGEYHNKLHEELKKELDN